MAVFSLCPARLDSDEKLAGNNYRFGEGVRRMRDHEIRFGRNYNASQLNDQAAGQLLTKDLVS